MPSPKGKPKIKKNNRRKKKKQHSDIKLLVFLFLLFVSVIGLGWGIYQFRQYMKQDTKFDSEKYYVKGIDVSHHNPILNWNVAAEDNISFAYLKATEGSDHLDRNYIYNYQLAKDAGIKVGSYHFYIFGASGIEQAKFFIKTANCQSGDLLPAIDVEHSPANPYSKDKDYRNLVVTELQNLEKELYKYYGVHPVIYSNKDCYKLYIQNNFPDNLMWISDLHNEPSTDITNWRIWQFSHEGKLTGLNENIDLNYYRYSFQEFKELLLP